MAKKKNTKMYREEFDYVIMVTKEKAFEHQRQHTGKIEQKDDSLLFTETDDVHYIPVYDRTVQHTHPLKKDARHRARLTYKDSEDMYCITFKMTREQMLTRGAEGDQLFDNRERLLAELWDYATKHAKQFNP